MTDMFPHLDPAYEAERQRATDELDANYPGQLVAYTDTWAGTSLTRVVVVATHDEQEFQDRLRGLAPDVRRRVVLTQVPEPGVISLGGAEYQFE
ncbi:MAG: hypothetical protein K2X87_32260 [Gemmataceae bacterium]|nr:hypothetical protein [Gemmataceae bacterium]